MFKEHAKELFRELAKAKIMVLSTSWEDRVSSRMMSVIRLEEFFYFQTDTTFRKYEQIKHNPNVALCFDNVQVEGICEEIGKPMDHVEFSEAFQECFQGSFEKYSALENERLFRVKPVFIQRWIYVEGIPFIERFDFENEKYSKEEYI